MRDREPTDDHDPRRPALRARLPRLLDRAGILLTVVLVSLSAGVLVSDEGLRIGTGTASDPPLATPSRRPGNGSPGSTAECDPRSGPLLAARAPVKVARRWITGTMPTGIEGEEPQPFSASLPQVVAGVPDAVRDRINAALRDQVVQLTPGTRATVTDEAPAGVDPDLLFAADDRDDRLLSGVFQVLVPAIDDTVTLRFAVDLADGRMVPPRTVFPTGETCRRRLCELINRELRAEAPLAPGAEKCPYLAPDPGPAEPGPGMVVRRGGIDVVFGVCEVTACAAGTVTVRIPFEDL